MLRCYLGVLGCSGPGALAGDGVFRSFVAHGSSSGLAIALLVGAVVGGCGGLAQFCMARRSTEGPRGRCTIIIVAVSLIMLGSDAPIVVASVTGTSRWLTVLGTAIYLTGVLIQFADAWGIGPPVPVRDEVEPTPSLA